MVWWDMGLLLMKILEEEERALAWVSVGLMSSVGSARLATETFC